MITHPRTSLLLLVGALLTTLALAAVSGPVATADARSKCRGANKSPTDLTAKRAQRLVVCLVNRERRARDLGRLQQHRKLKKAASRHTRKMIRSGCFEHRCKGEPDLIGRLERVGYLPCRCSWGAGETIALGVRRKGSPRSIVKGWMNSSPHRKILLTGRYDDVGVGFGRGVPGDPRRVGGTYTLNAAFKR
jgi:uncharacterized protein YkwD